MKTTIEQSILDQIKTHLENAYPHEACGFLLGNDIAGDRQITHIIEVENKSTENQRRRFVIDPLDYLRAEKQAAKESLALLGVYHSHPDHPAEPSVHDLEFAQPFFSYFIHSITSGSMTDTRSYRLNEGNFIEEQIHINQTIEL
jgi:proteasome lid subunit RPN8/RPN11